MLSADIAMDDSKRELRLDEGQSEDLNAVKSGFGYWAVEGRKTYELSMYRFLH